MQVQVQKDAIVEGKNCPFASGFVIPPPPPVPQPGRQTTIALAGVGNVNVAPAHTVQMQFLAAPCLRTCQFFDPGTSGCAIAVVAAAAMLQAAQIAEAQRAWAAAAGGPFPTDTAGAEPEPAAEPAVVPAREPGESAADYFKRVMAQRRQQQEGGADDE